MSPGDAGLYVHFPWCARLCPYCDFNVRVGRFDGGAYADAVIAEIAARGPDYGAAGFATLYFGGGTPSLWAPADLARVTAFVRDRFGLAGGAEVTLEANPEALPEDRLASHLAAGINRVSLGAQSFRPEELRRLGRVHGPEDIEAAARHTKALGMRLSIDLIYALPGQTWDEVRESIDRAAELEPDHVSAYTLTIEPATHFGRRARAGKLVPMEDDAQAELVERVAERLETLGYPRYEVSSFAPPGKEAVHNSLYWIGARYLGVGAGAHSYLPAPGLRSAGRRENARDPAAYMKGAPPSFEEVLDRRSAVGERLIVGMRARWGVDVPALASETGLALEPALAPAIDALAADGLVEREGDRVRPSPKGFLLADTVARRLLEALEGVQIPEASDRLEVFPRPSLR